MLFQDSKGKLHCHLKRGNFLYQCSKKESECYSHRQLGSYTIVSLAKQAHQRLKTLVSRGQVLAYSFEQLSRFVWAVFVLFTRVELFNLILHIYVVSKCLIVQLLLHFYSSRKRLSKVKPKMEFSDFGSRKRISHSSWI